MRGSVNETAIRYQKQSDTEAIRYSVTGALVFCLVFNLAEEMLSDYSDRIGRR